MRRFLVLLSAFALLAALAPPASARHVTRPVKGTTSAPAAPSEAGPQQFYPPGPGPDAAVIAINTGTWQVRRSNVVEVVVENHGSEGALIMVRLSASSDRFRATVRPSIRRIWLEPGDSASVLFIVRPRRGGTYELVACATAIWPAEVHPEDDCMTATTTAV